MSPLEKVQDILSGADRMLSWGTVPNRNRILEALDIVNELVKDEESERVPYEHSPEVRKALDDYHQRRAQAQLEAKLLYGGES